MMCLLKLFRRRKKRFKERIVPGYTRTEDTREFFIPQIRKMEDKKTSKQKFVSPVFGKTAKDEISIPNDHKAYGDIDKKYDIFRQKKRLTKEEAKKRYGHSYYEFTHVSTRDMEKIYSGEYSRDDVKTPHHEQVSPEASQDTEDESQTPEAVSIDDFFAGAKQFEKESSDSAEDDVLRDIEAEDNDGGGSLDKDRFAPMDDHDEDILYKGESDQERESFDEDATQKAEQDIRFSQDFDYVEDEENEENKPKLSEEKKEQIRSELGKTRGSYKLPPITLFNKSNKKDNDEPDWVKNNISLIDETLVSFNVNAEVVDYTKGPTVTRYEVSLGPGVSTKKVTGLIDNLQMSLSAVSIRIEAPIPGKNTIGIEVPNEVRESVFFGDVADNPKFLRADDPLLLAVGLNIDAEPVYTSIESMPHGLVAGSTQSGKSVCIASIIASLISRNRPDQVKLMLIDPKKVDLQQFADIPHLVTPIIDEPVVASESLKWMVKEMERRYDILKENRVVNVSYYQEKFGDNPDYESMPRIVVIIEEASDLLLSSGLDVEESILKLTQKSRAVGIHLLLATQRPSADILKGAIKANIPTRFGFKVPSSTDSNVVLDMSGAEKLLGKGDMLLMENGLAQRLQGAYLSPQEIEELTLYVSEQMDPDFLFTHESLEKKAKEDVSKEEIDELFEAVARYVVRENRCSLNKITQEFNIGFNRAVQIVETLEKEGVVSGNVGTKARDVLVNEEDLQDIFEEIGL